MALLSMIRIAILSVVVNHALAQTIANIANVSICSWPQLRGKKLLPDKMADGPYHNAVCYLQNVVDVGLLTMKLLFSNRSP